MTKVKINLPFSYLYLHMVIYIEIRLKQGGNGFMSDSEDTAVIEDHRAMFQTMGRFGNWSQIQVILKDLADGAYTSAQILKILKKFKYFSMRNRGQEKYFDKKIYFQALEGLYDDVLPELFQKISSFILKKKDYEYPLFQRQKAMEHHFTKDSILFLVCSMTLCLIPKQVYHQTEHGKDYYSYQTDFSFIFQKNQYKTKCVIEYLKKELKREKREQYLTIRREVVGDRLEQLFEKVKDRKLCKLTMTGDNESIQDFYGQIKTDFANRFIGGGALSSGCVQEEIMFANHPELFAAQLLCEAMDQNEAIHLIGFKKYCCNKGYSYTTSYLGPQLNIYKYDEQKRAKEYITAIDASVLSKDSVEQYSRKKIEREIMKAYAGFRFHGGGNKIVTGNWGCGAFRGDIRIKLIIQWLACSLAEKELLYCPFGQRQKVYNKQLFLKLSSLPIKQVYSLLREAGYVCLKEDKKHNVDQIDIYEKIGFLLDQKYPHFLKLKK